MPEVNVEINGRKYRMACEEGQQGHLIALAERFNASVEGLKGAVGEIGDNRLTVVTGAPNVAQGQTVALALAGARLIDGHSEGKVYKTLKPGKIRGVVSEGMVCSEKELGISEEHEGIMVLPDDAPLGAPLVDYLGDTVIEFEITPNLVHAFSVHGIARELRKEIRTPALNRVRLPRRVPGGRRPIRVPLLPGAARHDRCVRGLRQDDPRLRPLLRQHPGDTLQRASRSEPGDPVVEPLSGEVGHDLTRGGS